MMRRVPEWFNAKSQARFQNIWPWALSATMASLYFYNPRPFDDLGAAAITKMRKPLLKVTEWMDVHDIDPEALALELPPDQLFGPLSLEQQFVFLMQALKNDNELADGYIARMFIDNMDLSLDQPVVSEERILKVGGKDLLDFALADFTESRVPRKHKFFHPDNFICLVSWLAIYPNLAEHFVKDLNGISCLLTALRHCKEDYSRVLAMRVFTLLALQQRNDGEVEKELLRRNALKVVIDCYRQSTGDPTDTRFLTTILSSTIRHYPEAAKREIQLHNGVEVTLQALNTSRYKGVEQHLRVLRDMRRYFLPEAVEMKIISEGAKLKRLRISPALPSGEFDVDRTLVESDFLPVALGVLEVFPEYYESVRDISFLIRDVYFRTRALKMRQVPEEFYKSNVHEKNTGEKTSTNTAPLNEDPLLSPFDLLQYRALNIFSKLYVRYQFDEAFAADGTRAALAELAECIINDRTCQRALDKTVAPYDLVAAESAMRQMIEEEQIYNTRPAVLRNGSSNEQQQSKKEMTRQSIRDSSLAMRGSGGHPAAAVTA